MKTNTDIILTAKDKIGILLFYKRCRSLIQFLEAYVDITLFAGKIKRLYDKDIFIYAKLESVIK